MNTDNDDDFYHIDSATGEIVYDIDHYEFKTLKTAFASAGVDIFTLKSEAALDQIWHELSAVVAEFVQMRLLKRKSKGLDAQLLQAIVRSDDEEYERVSVLLDKRKEVGLIII